MKKGTRYRHYQSLIIDGNHYDSKSLSLLVENKLEQSLDDWEFQLWSFLNDWINESDSILLNTSGSTGPARTIAFHKDQLIDSALLSQKAFGYQKGERALICLPANYIAGKMMVVRAMVSELDLLVVKPAKDPSGHLNLPIGFAAMMPYQFEAGMQSSPSNIDNIKTLILGGMKVNDAVESLARNVNTNVYETFGMTETLTHIAYRKLNRDKFFKVLDGIKISTDKDQCLVINAKHLSEEAIYTNDIVSLQSMNEFKILGRKDNVINSGGIKIFPESLEVKLSNHLSEKYFVTGIRDEEFGQLPVLIIEEKEDEFLMESIAHLFSKIEMPKKLLRVPEIFLTKTGKVDRPKTRKTYNLL